MYISGSVKDFNYSATDNKMQFLQQTHFPNKKQIKIVLRRKVCANKKVNKIDIFFNKIEFIRAHLWKKKQENDDGSSMARRPGGLLLCRGPLGDARTVPLLRRDTRRRIVVSIRRKVGEHDDVCAIRSSPTFNFSTIHAVCPLPFDVTP